MHLYCRCGYPILVTASWGGDDYDILTLRRGYSPTDARDRREMALEVERTPAIPDLLYARGLPGPNRSGGRGAV